MSASLKAEESVIGHMLADEQSIPGILGTGLQHGHFHHPALKVVYAHVLDAFYAEDPIDPLTIAATAGSRLERAWKCSVDEAAVRLQSMTGIWGSGDVVAHAKVIRRDHDYRALSLLAANFQAALTERDVLPAELAGELSQRVTEVVTSAVHRPEIVSMGDLGRNYIKYQQELRAARAAGIEIGAYFGMDCIDDWTRGLKPTEVYFLAGEPGVGKSGVAWRAALNFALRQSQRPPDARMGTFVASLEMSETPAAGRVAQGISGVNGGALRDGTLDDFSMQHLTQEWAARKDLPLYFNFSSAMKASELRVLVAEAVRKHNVGFVVIDHFRYFDMDRRYDTKLEEDEEKAKFLTQRIAKELNVAVMCLAHTVKMDAQVNQGRPTMAHLRGSGQIAAEVDFLAFVYRPYKHASQRAKDDGEVLKTDAELIYAKNRHGLDGTAEFYFDPATLTTRNR